VYDYHVDLKEKPIGVKDAEKIVSRLDRMWKIKTIQLYPEKWDDTGFGWSLARKRAVIQLPPSMRTVSYIIHEHTHGVVESFRNYFKEFRGFREPGHGPLFCGIMAYNFHWITKKNHLDILDEMGYYAIRVLDKEPVLMFKEFFRG